MRHAAFGLALAAALGMAPALRADTAAQGWEKFGEDDGITVYRKDIQGSPIIALRGEGVVNAPILRVASVLIDTKRSPEWIDSVAETRNIRKVSDTEYVEWDHVKTPFILKDRDFVFDTKLELDKDNKQLALNYHSVNDPDAPKTDYVRGEFIYGKFVLTSLEGGKKTRVLAELLCDPKGSVAKWIVNMFQKDWPHKTIESLRGQVRKPDISDDARLKDALEKAGL